MHQQILTIHPADNVSVALEDLPASTTVIIGNEPVVLQEEIPSKHKFALSDFATGDTIIMYGVTVGKARQPISRGSRITTQNIVHASAEYSQKSESRTWEAPDVAAFIDRHFQGYHRSNGQVGTRNYWLVFPLVFCENRNIEVIKASMLEKLGYATEREYAINIDQLIQRYREGDDADQLLATDVVYGSKDIRENQLFPNVDGIKFLTHQGGCGGIRQDSETLCRLFAGYLNHPNVAGATVLSLGCQNAQPKLLREAIARINPQFDKPLYLLEQQKSSSERAFIAEAVTKTFVGLTLANKVERRAAPLSKLTLGLECGGSDGFSGLSANPALGYTTDLLVGLGGAAMLAEFPELNGVEQELINRCKDAGQAEKFAQLMRIYAKRVEEKGSSFAMNPSPGNIKDGLVTDAMKSAGAAKKGGTSPVVGVLDYTEQVRQPGLHLLCTPGNDVESTTGLAGSGANLMVFTTGLGTPTGNPITPTIKMASNTKLATQMPDLIDLDAGTIISGQDTIESKGIALLELLIQVASGKVKTRAELLGQDDFIPWKRGISL